jgi:hypothetical protein
MIGSCDCCDRQCVPVSRFSASAAYPEGIACFICQGDADPDPYGELEDATALTPTRRQAKTFNPLDAGFSLVDDGKFCRSDDPDCRHPLCDCARYDNGGADGKPRADFIEETANQKKAIEDALALLPCPTTSALTQADRGGAT